VIKKAAPTRVENQEEFERVDDRPQTTGGRGGRRGRGDGERGGRGGRGDGERGGRGERRGRGDGERGGRGDGERGGRGERRGRGDGERRGRGDGERGGRGRGRPRTAGPGEEGTAQLDRAEAGGQPRRSRYEGKAREEAHPFDRQDGTGRGRRGDRKQGQSRGDWGGNKATKEEIVGAEAEEEKKGEPTEEVKAPRRERQPQPQPVVEEEEVGYTLDDYFADKQAKSKGLAVESKQLREKEKISEKVATRDAEKATI